MSDRLQAIQKTRAHILLRGLGRLCDPTDPYTHSDIINLRTRFAANAATLKIPNEHKWIIKLAHFFDSVAAATTPRLREAQYYAIDKTLKQNYESFKGCNPAFFDIDIAPNSQPN